MVFKAIGRMLGLSSPKGIVNPAQQAMPYLNQVPGIGKQYHEPFIQSGQEAQKVTRPIYERMAQDPAAFLNALMEGYTPSRGYQTREKVLSQALRNSAAQGGYAGTPYAMNQQGELINDLMSGDQQQFLNNLMGIQGQGMGGLEGMVGRGHQSSSNLADYLGNALTQQGSLAFQGQAQQNQNKYDQMANRSRFWGDIAKAIGMGMGAGAVAGQSPVYNQYTMPAGGIRGGGSFMWQNPNTWRGGY